jgi:hypothetical protein
MFEQSIYRAMRRRGPRHREFARDAFQDLCCALLVNPQAVLGRFDSGRVSLQTHLTRWVRRRVWELMYRRECLARRRPLVDEPTSAEQGPAEEFDEQGQPFKEQARRALRFLTKGQRALIKAVLEGKLVEIVDRLSQRTLRQTLRRIMRRLKEVPGEDQHVARTRPGALNLVKDAQSQPNKTEPQPMARPCLNT